MGVVRNGIPPAYCQDDVQCEDILTAVNYNKLLSSVRNLQQIGTMGAEIPAKMINNCLRPAHGWSQGTFSITDHTVPGTYNVITTHGLPFFNDLGRFTLCYDARLLFNTTIAGAQAVRHILEVSISAIGYNGATQTLSEVLLPSTLPTPVSFAQAGGTIASPGASTFREVDAAWNSNMLPPSGQMWQGTLVLTLRITKAQISPLTFFPKLNLTLPGLLDWFGVRQLQLRHYKKCA